MISMFNLQHPLLKKTKNTNKIRNNLFSQIFAIFEFKTRLYIDKEMRLNAICNVNIDSVFKGLMEWDIYLQQSLTYKLF